MDVLLGFIKQEDFQTLAALEPAVQQKISKLRYVEAFRGEGVLGEDVEAFDDFVDVLEGGGAGGGEGYTCGVRTDRKPPRRTCPCTLIRTARLPPHAPRARTNK